MGGATEGRALMGVAEKETGESGRDVDAGSLE